MNELLENIENIKEKLSSKEYNDILENMKRINEQLEPEDQFDVLYPVCKIRKNDNGSIKLYPELKNIRMSQKDFMVYDACKLNITDLYQYPFILFWESLSDDNRSKMLELQCEGNTRHDGLSEDEVEHYNPDYVYVRYLKYEDLN